MAAVALSAGKSQVRCTDGAKGNPCGPGKFFWDTPTVQVSAAGSPNVFINTIGAVRKDDAMATHPDGVPCTSSPINHAPLLSTFSPNVFVNNKPLGRIGDKYNSDGHKDHTISSGSSNVYGNGGGPSGGATSSGGSTSNSGDNSVLLNGDPNVPPAGGGRANFNVQEYLDSLPPVGRQNELDIARVVALNGGYPGNGVICVSTDPISGAIIFPREYVGSGGGVYSDVRFPDGSRLTILPSAGDPYDYIRQYTGPTTGNFGITDDTINQLVAARNTQDYTNIPGMSTPASYFGGSWPIIN